MYRIQSEDYLYYRMAIRRGTAVQFDNIKVRSFREYLNSNSTKKSE
ncbi:hypothetical protein [Bacillus sp. Hm123]